jgi:hypothetical protein
VAEGASDESNARNRRKLDPEIEQQVQKATARYIYKAWNIMNPLVKFRQELDRCKDVETAAVKGHTLILDDQHDIEVPQIQIMFQNHFASSKSQPLFDIFTCVLQGSEIMIITDKQVFSANRIIASADTAEKLLTQFHAHRKATREIGDAVRDTFHKDAIKTHFRIESLAPEAWRIWIQCKTTPIRFYHQAYCLQRQPKGWTAEGRLFLGNSRRMTFPSLKEAIDLTIINHLKSCRKNNITEIKTRNEIAEFGC